MSTMITEIYDALRAAGAPEDKAKEAAKAVAHDIEDMKRDVHLVKWMAGVNIALSLAILARLLIK
ncbi:MAG: integrase [Thermodesulfobacteriota bacterium]